MNIKTAHSFHWLNVYNEDFVIASSPGPSFWRFSKWRIVGRNPWQRLGAFPFTKKFRKSRSGCKWNTSFWVVPLEIFRNKRNSWKGSPVFPLKTSQWKICVPFTDLLSLSPVPCLLRSIKRPGLTRISEFFVIGKRPGSRGTKSPKNLGDFHHGTFWEDQKKMAAKVVFGFTVKCGSVIHKALMTSRKDSRLFSLGFGSRSLS